MAPYLMQYLKVPPPRSHACSQRCFSLPRLRQYCSVCMPQGTCVYVRPGRRQKMTPDLYLSAFKSRVLWLNTTTEQFARCKTLRLNRWFSAPCQVILPWQRWLQRYQLFIFFSIFSFLILTHERRHSQIFLNGSCSCNALVFSNMWHC